MKKTLISALGILLLSFVIATPVNAKNQAVTIDEVTAYASSFSVKGSTPAVAVTIQIRDASNNIVAMDTVGTKDGKFSKSVAGSFTAGSGYKVYIADYEGGTWEKKSVTASADPVAPSDSGLDSGNDSNSGDDSSSTSTKTQTAATTTQKTGSNSTTNKTGTATTDSGKKTSEKDTNKNTDKIADNKTNADTGIKNPGTENVEDGNKSDTVLVKDPTLTEDSSTSAGLTTPVKIALLSVIAILAVAAVTGLILLIARRKNDDEE